MTTAQVSTLARFVNTCCSRSPLGERLEIVYDTYAQWTRQQQLALVEAGVFRWWMRQRCDSVWLGRSSGGEWLVGVGLVAEVQS